MVLLQAGLFLPCWLLHLVVGAPSAPCPHHRSLVAWRQRVCDLRALLVPRVGVFVRQVVFVRALVCKRIGLLVCFSCLPFLGFCFAILRFVVAAFACFVQSSSRVLFSYFLFFWAGLWVDLV